MFGGGGSFAKPGVAPIVEDSIALPSGADDSRNAISDVGLLIMANPNRIREKPVALSEVSEELIRAPLLPPQDNNIAAPQNADDDRLFINNNSNNLDDRPPLEKRAAHGDLEEDGFLVPEDGLYGNQAPTHSMPAAARVGGDRGGGTDSGVIVDVNDTILPPFPSFAKQYGGGGGGGGAESSGVRRADADRARLRATQGTPLPPLHMRMLDGADGIGDGGIGGGGVGAGDAITASQQQTTIPAAERRRDEESSAAASRKKKAAAAAATASEDAKDRQQRDHQINEPQRESTKNSSSKSATGSEQQREQSFAEFEAEIQRQAKEQEDTEKREMILLFYEKQNFEKIKVPAKFLGEDAMNCDLHEMRWWYYKLVRDTRIQDAVGGIKQNIVQFARAALITNNTIGNPLNLRLDANFPTELASVLNNKLDRHLRDYVKSKCGISGPKPNPMRHVAMGVFETVWNYHRNRVALENSEKKAQRDANAAAAQHQQQQQHDMFNPARMFGQQPLFPHQQQPLYPQQPTYAVNPDEYQQFLHWKQMAAARQYQQQHPQFQQHQQPQHAPQYQQQQQKQQQQQQHNPLAQSQMYGNGLDMPRAPQWRAPAVPAQQPAAPTLSSLAPPNVASALAAVGQQQQQRPPQPPSSAPQRAPPAFNRKPLQNALRFMNAADRQAPLRPDLRPPTIPPRQPTAVHAGLTSVVPPRPNAPSPGLRGDMSLADAARAIQDELRLQQQQQPEQQGTSGQPSAPLPASLNAPLTIPARRVVHGSLPFAALQQQQQPQQHQQPPSGDAKKTLTNTNNSSLSALRSVPAPSAAMLPPQRPRSLDRQPLVPPKPAPVAAAVVARPALPSLVPPQRPRPAAATIERPVGNHLGQIEVRPSRAKTYDDLIADLESAANASRRQQQEAGGGDDLAAISHDDLAHAPNFMPEISLQDKVGDTLSLLEGVLKPAPKEDYRPVLDVDDILGNKKPGNAGAGGGGRGAPITSLEEVRRLKQRQKAEQQASASHSVSLSDRGGGGLPGNGASGNDDSLRTITKPSAANAMPTRKRRKAAAGSAGDDAPVRIIREPESPAVVVRQPAREEQRTPPSTPPRDFGSGGGGAAAGSGGGSAMRSQTRTGRTQVTF
jgi:hypothetical protein